MTTTYRKGDVIFVKNENTAVLGVQSGSRPYLVVSNDKFNQYSPVLNCVPLSTKTTKKSPVHFFLSKSVGLQYDSVVLCEQLQVVSKNSVSYVMCTVPSTLLIQINQLLQFQLAL